MIELLKFYRLRFVSQLVRLHPAFLRDAKHVLRLQQQRFRKLIKHAGRASPHYERKFAGINLETCGLTDLPILTKHEMMENFEDVVTDRTLRREDIQKFVEDPCNLGKLFKGKYAVAHTSGSLGRPALIVQDGDALALTLAVQVVRGSSRRRAWRSLPSAQAFIQAVSFSATCRPSSSFSSGSNGFRCLTPLSKRSRCSTNSSPI